MYSESISLVIASSAAFFLAFAGDKAKDRIQMLIKHGPDAEFEDQRWDAGIVGHRFLPLSVGFLFTLAWYLDTGVISFLWIPNANISHTMIIYTVYFFLLGWGVCIFLLSTLRGRSHSKRKFINFLGLFSFFITIAALFGVTV
jgi:hypothetical protein